MTDKLKHFAAGFLITLVLGLLFNLWIGFFAGIIAGIAKELYDMTGRGTPDIQDAVVTAAGSSVAAALITLLI